MSDKYDGLQEIIDGALADMAAEAGGSFDPQGCNLAEFCRKTGLSRQRARTIKANGFKAKPHGRLGTKAAKTVLSGHTGFVDDQLRKGVTNSQVVFERLVGQGYHGRTRAPRAGKTQGGRPTRKPWSAVPERPGRVLPDGLGLRERRRLGGE